MYSHKDKVRHDELRDAATYSADTDALRLRHTSEKKSVFTVVVGVISEESTVVQLSRLHP